MTVAQRFAPRIDELDALVAFTAAAFEREGIDRDLLPAVELALEELFTNVVKYEHGATGMQVEVRALPAGVEVSLSADGVDDFDPTRAPAADIGLPIEQREPGGLGLHLIRRLMDSIEYGYQVSDRRSRITFRKTRA